MTKADISIDLAELATILRLAEVGVEKGHYSAAISYLEDIESDAIRLRKAIEEMRGWPSIPAGMKLTMGGLTTDLRRDPCS